MSGNGRPLKLAVIAGEESGDLLGADLVGAIKARLESDLDLIGVGGDHLQAEGLRSLFDPGIIAIMGVSAVVRDMPRLLRLIGSTARQVAAAKPDCVVTIDSPAFNLRVARKIRRLDPSIPIVKYVCPSVWAWLPGRAARMKAYTDHVLCLLPFEPAELERLGGPSGTFVGHRLTQHPGVLAARAMQEKRKSEAGGSMNLLLLPGSRRGEVAALAAPFVEAANLLMARGHGLNVRIPTVPRVEAAVRTAAAKLNTDVEVTTGDEAKWRAFGTADAALAASGTVSLELALAGVPLISCYRSDPLMKLTYPLISTWSASLPNLIADSPIVPEFYDRFVRPQHLARSIEAIGGDGPARKAQVQGFEKVRRALKTDRPAGEIAAEIVLRLAGARNLNVDTD
ncbi:MAG: lipid-A-disaccharide synthase [Rhizobiaceae bacterium]